MNAEDYCFWMVCFSIFTGLLKVPYYYYLKNKADEKMDYQPPMPKKKD